MMRTTLTFLLLAWTVGLVAYATASEPSPEGFEAFLQSWEEGQELFLNGDPSAWKRSVSQGNDGTIFGAFGGYEKGVEVGARYDWASSQYEKSGATKRIEYLSRVVGDELAVTVSIERATVRFRGRKGPIDQALRATQVFRWEDGGWRLLHRHADPMLEKKTPPRDSG